MLFILLKKSKNKFSWIPTIAAQLVLLQIESVNQQLCLDHLLDDVIAPYFCPSDTGQNCMFSKQTEQNNACPIRIDTAFNEFHKTKKSVS